MTPLAAAQAELGYVEQGGADGRSGNITKFWAWWLDQTGENDQGASWCGCFVSWCFDEADARFTISGKPGFVYCPFGENWFRSQGLLVDVAHAQPGDVAFFHFVGEANEANHTGIVESVDPGNQTITCIEGNTSSGTVGNQSNGGGVYRRTRPWSCVRSVGHAAWVHPTPPPVQEETLMLTTIHATPTGVTVPIGGLAGNMPVAASDRRSVAKTQKGQDVWQAAGLDGHLYVYSDPAGDVDVAHA